MYAVRFLSIIGQPSLLEIYCSNHFNCQCSAIDAISIHREQIKNHITIDKMRSHRPVSRSIFIISVALYFMQSALPAAKAYNLNGSLLIGHTQTHIDGRYVKYTIDDLMNGRFEYKVSDDIYMDPCKSSMYIVLYILLCCSVFSKSILECSPFDCS